jgi:hypothetical protein
MRVAGEAERDISLFLRREIEGEKVKLASDMHQAKTNESLAKEQAENLVKERDFVYEQFRVKRKKELQDKYDLELRNNRIMFLIVPVAVAFLIIITLKNFLKDSTGLSQFATGIIIEIIFGILPFYPINKKLIKTHSSYVYDIDKLVEEEISKMRVNVTLNSK